MEIPMGTRDENDRHRSGDLPDDPFADAVPVVSAVEAAASAEREKRIATLRGRKLETFLPASLARMRARRDGTEKPIPLPDQWRHTADELRGGLWPGCFVLIGGTGSGKSQWAFEVAHNAAVRHAVPVLYVGLELDEGGVSARLAALGLHHAARSASDGRRIHPPWSGLYLGHRPDIADLDEHGDAVIADLEAAPFYLVTGEARGWSYTELGGLVADLRSMHPDAGPVLVIVDFLQLVSGDPSKPRETLREYIGGAAYAARMASRTYNAAVLLVSSTSRSAYPMFQGKGDSGDVVPLGKGDPSRFVGTGKESGEVEYAADGVIALCRSPRTDAEQNPPVWLAIAKSRTGHRSPAEGGTGWVRYRFNGTTFVEEGPHQEAGGGKTAASATPTGGERNRPRRGDLE